MGVLTAKIYQHLVVSFSLCLWKCLWLLSQMIEWIGDCRIWSRMSDHRGHSWGLSWVRTWVRLLISWLMGTVMIDPVRAYWSAEKELLSPLTLIHSVSSTPFGLNWWEVFFIQLLIKLVSWDTCLCLCMYSSVSVYPCVCLCPCLYLSTCSFVLTYRTLQAMFRQGQLNYNFTFSRYAKFTGSDK